MQTLKEETHRRIIDVARREFIAHGASGTSIRTIAHKAGMAVGNVYNYFRSKDELFREVLRPPIILLDEATASLDAENETRIQAALSELVRQKTVIIIAHRMRTVRHADKIVVFSGGTVKEQGTPEALMAQGGEFAKMVLLQQGN